MKLRSTEKSFCSVYCFRIMSSRSCNKPFYEVLCRIGYCTVNGTVHPKENRKETYQLLSASFRASWIQPFVRTLAL